MSHVTFTHVLNFIKAYLSSIQLPNTITVETQESNTHFSMEWVNSEDNFFPIISIDLDFQVAAKCAELHCWGKSYMILDKGTSFVEVCLYLEEARRYTQAYINGYSKASA